MFPFQNSFSSISLTLLSCVRLLQFCYVYFPLSLFCFPLFYSLCSTVPPQFHYVYFPPQFHCVYFPHRFHCVYFSSSIPLCIFSYVVQLCLLHNLILLSVFPPLFYCVCVLLYLLYCQFCPPLLCCSILPPPSSVPLLFYCFYFSFL